MHEEERYRLWLYTALRAGNAYMRALLASYGSARAVYERAKEGAPLVLEKGPRGVDAALRAAAREEKVEEALAAAARAGLRCISRVSPDYPYLLEQIYDPPEILFIKGRLPAAPELPLAVVGTRHCSEYGRNTAERFARELSQAGALIVSGLAYGIDAAAARGALQSGKELPTVAVLGCGADVVYPASSAALYAEVAERGAVISEFLPGTQPLRGHFPRRNRIMSGLSRGVLVVEAGARSGASITVNYALEQGRDVFAVPGRITDAKSLGTNRFIRDGYAKAVLETRDVLVEYGLGDGEDETACAKKEMPALPDAQAQVYRMLQEGEKNFDELCELGAFSAAELNSVLTVMEFSGIIRQVSGRMYSITE